MINALVERALAVFNGENRLKADFPWSFGQASRAYLVACLYFALGTFLPVAVFWGILYFAPDFAFSNFFEETVTRFSPDHGRVTISLKQSVMAVLVASTFLSGFLLQLWYISRVFKNDGKSLSECMAINLNSLGGSLWGATWRAALAFTGLMLAEQALSLVSLSQPTDPATEFIKTFGGWQFLLIAAVISLAAPVLEELVFRGFLFNVMRTSFRQFSLNKLHLTMFTATSIIAGIMVYILDPNSAAQPMKFVLAGIAGMLCTVASTLLNSDSRADFAAILCSSAIFAAFHLNLPGFPILLIAGMVLSYLYLRSGSLITPMIAHAMVNTYAVLIVFLQVSKLV